MSVNYIDRFLERTENFPVERLDLLACCCILISTKIEQIYPPKIESLLAYIRQEGVSQTDFHEMELTILRVLNWNLCPPTPNYWVGVYLRRSVFCLNRIEKRFDFYSLNFKPKIFTSIMNLIDIVAHCPDFMIYRPSEIAAAAFFLYWNNEDDLIYRCTGMDMNKQNDCVNWLKGFVDFPLKIVPNQLLSDEVEWSNRHTIQTYNQMCSQLDIE